MENETEPEKKLSYYQRNKHQFNKPQHCDICDKTLRNTNFSRHVLTDKHVMNLLIKQHNKDELTDREEKQYCRLLKKNVLKQTL